MADLQNNDELLDLNDSENPEGSVNKINKRINDLNAKVILTAQERDEKDRLLKEQSTLLETTQKEVEFYKNFNTITSKYPQAAQFQDKIMEKVKAGYEYEDAAVAVLNKEGQFTAPTTPATPAPAPESLMGAPSAPTGLKGAADKPIAEMNQSERRAALQEAESRGDIALS